jgi:hypothetical protein
MVFAATSKEDWYRKPRVGMWNTFAKEMGISLKDGTSSSDIDSGLTMFFVGDAGGRIGGHATGRTADHGDTDRYYFSQQDNVGNSQ